MDMNKEELEKQLKKSGWEDFVEKESKFTGYSLCIRSNGSKIAFYSQRSHLVHIFLLDLEGARNKITKNDLFAIIDYLKKQRTDKPVIFKIQKKYMTAFWSQVIENYFSAEGYENVNTLPSKINQIIYLGNNPDVACYTTKKELKELKDHAEYLFEIERVGKENEKKPLFFYSHEPEYAGSINHFFFSIEGYQCLVSLKVENKLLKLLIAEKKVNASIVKEWDIHKKEDIGKYLKEYIKQIEKKRRIRNIYEMSTYFFEKYCAENSIYEWDAREELLRYYTVKELEEISINICKNKNKRKTIQKEDKKISFFDDKIIFTDMKKSELKVIVDQEEINQHMKEMRNDEYE